MYHMIEYIRDEPAALARTFTECESTILELITGVREGRWNRLVIVAVGSSYTASLMALPAFRMHSPIPVEVLPATELTHYQERWLGPETLVITVSRSGERGWVVDTQRTARAFGAYTVALTGVSDSLLASEAELVLPTAEGPEITFAKTKSVVTCTGVLMKLALRLAPVDDAAAQRHLRALVDVPKLMEQTIRSCEPVVEGIVPALSHIEHVYLGGSGSNYGAAVEGAMKIHEASFVPTKAEDTGGCLYGVFGALDSRWLVVSLMTDQDADLSRAVLRLTAAVGACSLLVAGRGMVVKGDADHVVEVAAGVDPLLSGLVYLPPLQLLTYYLTLARGKNPDAPSYAKVLYDAMLPTGRQEPEFRAVTTTAGSHLGA